jgi:anti-sigma-K factor RskA
MDNDKTDNAEKRVRKWKAIAIALAVVAALLLALPYMQSQEKDNELIINNEMHGVKKIASVDIEPGKVSPVKKNT